MSVVLSPSLVISDVVSGGGVINANNPLIGYDNLVTTTNVSTTTEDDSYPASNLANSSTNLRWQGLGGSPTADEYITVALGTSDNVDYVGIAHHNFYSEQITVSVEILDDSGSPEEWVEVISEFIPPNDGPLLMRFTPQGISSIRVRLQPSANSAAPYAAVLYIGELLVLQRRIFVGHTPINYGRSSKTVSPRSESGQFLGRIVLNEVTATKVTLQNLTGSWYRTYMDPFVKASKSDPFFFAWRPSSYPYEVGFVWMTNDPQPSNQRVNGMMQVSLEMNGIFE